MSEVQVTGLHHVTLLVDDIACSLAFYCDLLGLDVDMARPDLGYPGAWLQVGSAQIHLMELPSPDPLSGRPEHGGRDRHVALGVTALQPVLDQLQRAGIAYNLSRSGRRALFCRDPDQNVLELIESAP